MGLNDYRLKQTPDHTQQAEEIKQVGAHVIAQAKALRAECANLSLRLQAGTEAAKQVVAFADASSMEHQRQRELMNAAWDSGISVLEQIQRERELIEEHVAQAAQLAQAPAFPGAAAGANPGAVPPVPGAMYPAGPTPLSFLYQALQGSDLTSGGTIAGPLAINAAPGNHLAVDSRYAWRTDNVGSPPHTSTGPNLYLSDLTVSKDRIKFNSLGEAAFFISDPSLVNDGVSHTIQLWGMCGNGVAQAGFGTGVQIFLSDAAGVGQEAGNLQCWLENTAAGAVSSAIALLNRIGGAGQMVLYCDALGEVRFPAATSYLTVPHAPAVTTNYATISLGEAGFAGGGGTAFAGSPGGTQFAANAGAGFTGNFLDMQLAGVQLYKMTSAGQQSMWVRDANTNGPSSALVLSHKLSSGSPTVGFGSGLQLWGLDSGSTALQYADVVAEGLTLTPGAVSAAILFRTLIAGALTEGARIHSSGDFIGAFKLLATGGIGVGNSVAKTTLASPGTVIKAVPIFDQNGTLLGSVPVYSGGAFS